MQILIEYICIHRRRNFFPLFFRLCELVKIIYIFRTRPSVCIDTRLYCTSTGETNGMLAPMSLVTVGRVRKLQPKEKKHYRVRSAQCPIVALFFSNSFCKVVRLNIESVSPRLRATLCDTPVGYAVYAMRICQHVRPLRGFRGNARRQSLLRNVCEMTNDRRTKPSVAISGYCFVRVRDGREQTIKNIVKKKKKPCKTRSVYFPRETIKNSVVVDRRPSVRWRREICRRRFCTVVPLLAPHT